MRKSSVFLMSAVLLTILLFSAQAWARESGKGGERFGKEEYKCPVTAKLMEKARFILSNKDELGLSEDQLKKIKAIKMSAKKTHIRQGADMEILFLDIEEKMAEPKVNVDEIGLLIDKGAAGVVAATKQTVQEYADLKAVLTEEQMAKLKSLWWRKNK